MIPLKLFGILLLVGMLALTLLPLSVVQAAPIVETWESYTTGADNITAVYGGHWVAQSFTVTPESHSVRWVRLSMYRLGSPGTVVVGIREVDGSGFPIGDDLATGTVNANVMSNSTAAWYGILVDEYSLSYDTTYTIVVSAEEGDASNALYVMSDDSAATYAGGTKMHTTTGGLAWSEDTGHDLQFAIVGRALVSIEDVEVFTDLYEDGDMLFAISYWNTYVPQYPLDSAPAYFAMQLRATNGTTLISQVTCSAWGAPKPAEIYLSADTAASLDYGAPYVIAIEGIHLPEDPYDSYVLVDEDWKGGNLDLLDTWVISLAQEIEEVYDVTLVVASGSDNLLNDEGAVVFLTGMPSLMGVRPGLFVSGEFTPGDYETDAGSFDDVTTWDAEVGSTVADAVVDTADMVGVDEPQNMAGILLMVGYLALVCIVVAAGGDASIAAFLAIPVIAGGTQLRILPYAFIATIGAVAVILLVYRFWWSRT